MGGVVRVGDGMGVEGGGREIWGGVVGEVVATKALS